MKRKTLIFIGIIALAIVAFNVAIFSMNRRSVVLTKSECLSMRKRGDEAIVIGSRVAAKIADRPAYKYTISYFLVNTNMNFFWTSDMITSLSNCEKI
jgi:hypothetical protein